MGLGRGLTIRCLVRVHVMTGDPVGIGYQSRLRAMDNFVLPSAKIFLCRNGLAIASIYASLFRVFDVSKDISLRTLAVTDCRIITVLSSPRYFTGNFAALRSIVGIASWAIATRNVAC